MHKFKDSANYLDIMSSEFVNVLIFTLRRCACKWLYVLGSSVCLSVLPSVTLLNSVKTVKHVIIFFILY